MQLKNPEKSAFRHGWIQGLKPCPRLLAFFLISWFLFPFLGTMFRQVVMVAAEGLQLLKPIFFQGEVQQKSIFSCPQSSNKYSGFSLVEVGVHILILDKISVAAGMSLFTTYYSGGRNGWAIIMHWNGCSVEHWSGTENRLMEACGKNKDAHTFMLLSPPFCTWGTWGLERWRLLIRQVSGEAGRVASVISSHFCSTPPTTSALPPTAYSCPLPLSWSVLGAAKSLQDTGRVLGSPWRQQELSRGPRPINPVSSRGPFPRQRVIDVIISIFFNANYFFFHVNIKIILNVLIKADVISDHRIINLAWEDFQGRKCSLSHNGNSKWFRISSLYDF